MNAPVRVCAGLCLASSVLWILGCVPKFAEFALGLGLGALALALRLHAPVPVPDPGYTPFRLLQAPTPDTFGCRALVQAQGGEPGRISMRLPRDACHLLPGQRVAAHVELERPRPQTNPGGSDPRRRLARRGVHVAGRVTRDRWVAISGDSVQPGNAVERVRRRVARALDPLEAASPDRASALLRALATGDRHRLDPDTRRAFEDSGTVHLLAVSGLHVGWVLALVQVSAFGILRRSSRLFLLRRAGSLSRFVGIACACLYAALSGFGVPALRATTMAFAGALAISKGRTQASANALALACIVVLAADPGSLFDAGFALSFCAVAGLLLWRPPTSPLTGLIHCTLAATLATAPLVVAIGAPLPRDTLAANALAVPYFGLVVVPSALIAGAVGALLPASSESIIWPARVAAELGIRLVAALGSEDLNRWVAGSVELAAALSFCGFGLRLLLVGRQRAALFCATAALCALVIASLHAHDRGVGASVFFFDVGHGDAVLLRRGGAAWLVDAGPRLGRFDAGRHVIAPGLRTLGVPELDALAITHADSDHIGGAAGVLRQVGAREVWLPRLVLESEAAASLRDVAASRSIPIRVVAAGQSLRSGASRLRVLWPPAELDHVAPNHGSLVLRFETPEGCAFISGDLPARAERGLAGDQARCDVLKLGHHGSRTSTDPLLLDALDPLVAVASSGRRSRSVLPHPRVRELLSERSIPLWVTRRSGAIDVRLRAGTPHVLPFFLARSEAASGSGH